MTVSGPKAGLKGRASPIAVIFTSDDAGRGAVVVTVNTGAGKSTPTKMRRNYVERQEEAAP